MEKISLRDGQDVSGPLPLSCARLQRNSEDSNTRAIAQVDRGMLNRLWAELGYCWDSCLFLRNEHT